MNEKKVFVKEYITETECNYMCDDNVFDCSSCSCFEDCYLKACERCNNEFSSDVDYGGYNSEDIFWEQV